MRTGAGMSPGFRLPSSECTSTPSQTSIASLTRYSCERCIGLRVWKAATRDQPSRWNSARVSAGVMKSAPYSALKPPSESTFTGPARLTSGCSITMRTPGCSASTVRNTDLHSRTVRRVRARAHSAASASPESIRGLRKPPPCGGTRSGKLFSLLERRSREAGRVHAGQPHPGELQEARHQLGMKSFLRVNHRKIAQQRRPEGNLDELPELELLGGDDARHDGEAQARGDEPLQRLRAAELDHHVEGVRCDPRLLQVAVDDGAGPRARLPADIGMSGERRRQREGFSGHRVGGRAHDLELVLAADFAQQGGKVRITLDKAKVQGALGDAILHRLRIADEQRGHHGGKAPLELADQLRQQVLADRHAAADEKRARDLAAHVLQAGFELAGKGKDALGIIERHDTGRSKRDAAVRTVEQARVEGFLELLDLEGHRRLRHEERISRLGKGQMLCDGAENLKTPVGHEPFRYMERLFKHKTTEFGDGALTPKAALPVELGLRPRIQSTMW